VYVAASSLLALIDDIATVLDDVAAMTKVAARKTAGVLGDDLALNAQQVAGLAPERELPVVWSVTKGSFANKLVLVPAALAISAFAPWAVTPLLMAGGVFLCYEGCEKLAHRFLHSQDDDSVRNAQLVKAVSDPAVDIVAFEKGKIKGAIRTDFILSAEIIAITLGTVAQSTLGTQVTVLSAIALLMTVGVYGLVAGIVKLDDIGLHLSKQEGAGGWPRAQRLIGRRILATAPYLMKSLSILGTAAMFMVGGGILVHGIPGAEALIHDVAARTRGVPGIGNPLEVLAGVALNMIVGFAAGAIALFVATTVQRSFRPAKPAT
jgi:predicted DNA repair protein MutK